MPDYPEHDKLQVVHEDSQIIGEFLDWMSDQGIHRGVYDDDFYEGAFMRRSNKNITELLSEYFEIDQDKLEAEKLAILDDIRRQNEVMET